MSKSSSKLSKVARSIASGAVLASLAALDAVTTGSALAQSKPAQPSPTLQSEGLQRVEQKRRSAQDAKWRSFPRVDAPTRTASVGTPRQVEMDYRETFVQSPQGWLLVGININATVWWIKPSTVKGTAVDRTVLKLSLDPDRPTKLSESQVHINCVTAQQQQSHPSESQVRTPPLAINQGSTWESIAKIICPSGTYASGALARPLAPLR